MKIAVVPGSFDPMTLGHVNIIERAAALFDKVFVAVMINNSKSYMFNAEQRTEIARLSCAHIANAEVIFDDGMLADLALRLDACAIVKGVRNSQDFTYEFNMAGMNKRLNSETETLFLPCAPEYSFVSSTFARDLMKYQKSLKGVMADEAIEYIYEI